MQLATKDEMSKKICSWWASSGQPNSDPECCDDHAWVDVTWVIKHGFDHVAVLVCSYDGVEGSLVLLIMLWKPGL